MKSQRLAEHFIDSLKIIQQQKPIDLIIFSGDMIDKGGKGFPTMSEAFMNFKLLIIDKILSELNLDQERFVFVCGNHDVVRDKDNEYLESGLASKLNDITTLDDFVRDSKSIDKVKRMEDFNDFRHKF
jgi:predicted MPP superfamily phosphohydrolase